LTTGGVSVTVSAAAFAGSPSVPEEPQDIRTKVNRQVRQSSFFMVESVLSG
jgi:hypothetical protein